MTNFEYIVARHPELVEEMSEECPLDCPGVWTHNCDPCPDRSAILDWLEAERKEKA